MTSSDSRPISAFHCGRQTPDPVDARHSAVRVTGSAGLIKGELEVSSSEPQGSPVSTAIAILVLVAAAVLSAVVVGAASWLIGIPAMVRGLGAYGTLALVLGVGLFITFRRGQPGNRK